MAMSATAMGKIRLAAAAGQSIPADWAMAADGKPTTDPAEAIKGMLAPAAGPKGFGLAFVIDLLCGGLVGRRHRRAKCARSMAIRPSPIAAASFSSRSTSAPFRTARRFAKRVNEQAQRVTGSKRAPGITRVYAPGELAHATRLANAGHLHAEPADVRQPDRGRQAGRNRYRTL